MKQTKDFDNLKRRIEIGMPVGNLNIDEKRKVLKWILYEIDQTKEHYEKQIAELKEQIKNKEE